MKASGARAGPKATTRAASKTRETPEEVKPPADKKRSKSVAQKETSGKQSKGKPSTPSPHQLKKKDQEGTLKLSSSAPKR